MRKKYYSKVYREFLNQSVFPESFLNRIYGSQFVKTFYTQTEIDRFRAKWEKSVSDDSSSTVVTFSAVIKPNSKTAFYIMKPSSWSTLIIAFMVVLDSEMKAIRDALKPHRGQLYEE